MKMHDGNFDGNLTIDGCTEKSAILVNNGDFSFVKKRMRYRLMHDFLDDQPISDTPI